MKGLTWKSLRNHYSLIPLFVPVGLGVFGAFCYTIRLAVKNPDVSWTRSNPEPNRKYDKKQYKFVNISGMDYENYETGRPDFEKDE